MTDIIAIVGAVTGVIGSITGIASLIWLILNSKSNIKISSFTFGIPHLRKEGETFYVIAYVTLRNLGAKSATIEDASLFIGGFKSIDYEIQDAELGGTPVPCNVSKESSMRYKIYFEFDKSLYEPMKNAKNALIEIETTFGRLKKWHNRSDNIYITKK